MKPSNPLPSLTPEAQKRANRLKAISEDAPSKAKLFEKVFLGKASPRQAIKAMCCECLTFDVEAIRTCTAPACPLYAYRPFRKREG
jgi:hypothetical protein